MDTKIYLYGGGEESESMLPNIQKRKNNIEGQGFEASKLTSKPNWTQKANTTKNVGAKNSQKPSIGCFFEG